MIKNKGVPFMETEKKDLMQTFRRKSGKKRITVMIIAIVLVIAIIFFTSGNRRKAAMMEQANVAMQQTDFVATRSLVKSIGATGTIISLDSEDISVNLTGTEVKEVKVKIGDTVEKGDLLLSFDTEEIDENLAAAKKNLNNAVTKNKISKEEAARKVTDAERNYQNQIDSAQDAINNSEYAKISDALYNFDIYFSNLTADEKTQKRADLERKLDAAKPAYEEALKNYENIIATQESTLESTKNSQTTTNLSLSTTNEEKQVEQYQKQLDSAMVYAPISGVVTAIHYEAGDTYNGGTIITIQDCSSYQIEAEIGEYDISDVKLGQKVLIKTNATGNEEMEGVIQFISPTATTSVSGASTGNVTYAVKIAINNPSERLRLDMSASLSIIMEEHDNVMTVPYNAIQTKEDGSAFVMVKEKNGSFKEVTIDVVMESNYYTEIASNELTDGMEVLVIESESMTFMDMMNNGGPGGSSGNRPGGF